MLNIEGRGGIIVQLFLALSSALSIVPNTY